MKLTKEKLKKIIKEELESIMREDAQQPPPDQKNTKTQKQS